MSSIQTKPVIGPKAWRGDVLARETSWIVSFSNAEIAEIDHALAAAKATGQPLEEIGREQFPLTVARASVPPAQRCRL